MTDSKRLRILSRQRKLIAYLFDLLADAEDALREMEQEPATEGLLQEVLWEAQDGLRTVVDEITQVEYRMACASREPLVGG